MYDVAGIGLGISGAASAYALGFTNIESAIFLEKNEDAALVNSNTASNAQTLHGGDTETNFSLKKALRMREAEKLIAAFLERFGDGAFRKLYKMALGVGEAEVELLRNRFKIFKPYYPTLELLERDDIKEIEPLLLERRSAEEPVAALYRKNGYAVDYYKLAKCFLREAAKSGKIEFYFETKVRNISRRRNLFEIHTNKGLIRSRVLITTAGPYSLLYAKSLGAVNANDYTILPVAGSFYLAHIPLKGKIYTVQDPKFPFAAPHMDPDVNDPSLIRIGPTAKAIPLFERHHWLTIFDFMKSGVLSKEGLWALCKILADRDMIKFVAKNSFYDSPIFGKRSFLERAAKKIVPTLKTSDIAFAKGAGGIRPQLLNMKTSKLEMGTGKFIGTNSIFDVTPSPGASDSLRNAVINAKKCAEFLGSGFKFDEAKFNETLFGSAESKGGAL